MGLTKTGTANLTKRKERKKKIVRMAARLVTTGTTLLIPITPEVHNCYYGSPSETRWAAETPGHRKVQAWANIE